MNTIKISIFITFLLLKQVVSQDIDIDDIIILKKYGDNFVNQKLSQFKDYVEKGFQLKDLYKELKDYLVKAQTEDANLLLLYAEVLDKTLDHFDYLTSEDFDVFELEKELDILLQVIDVYKDVSFYCSISLEIPRKWIEARLDFMKKPEAIDIFKRMSRSLLEGSSKIGTFGMNIEPEIRKINDLMSSLETKNKDEILEPVINLKQMFKDRRDDLLFKEYASKAVKSLTWMMQNKYINFYDEP